jgi:hypothetical protein
MHINVDMHWCFHGHLHERMGYDVDIKVDDILDEHGHTHKEHVQKLLQNTHIVATLASSPLLTWSFFRLSKGYEC